MNSPLPETAFRTYKIRHSANLENQLIAAKKVAEYAIKNRHDFKLLSSKFVKHLGIKSLITNQILRKYGLNQKCQRVRNVLLTVPRAGCKILDNGKLLIYCLGITLDISFLPKFEKIIQVELNREYAFVAVSISCKEKKKSYGYIGVDRNTTGHIAVAANPISGKVFKLGKGALHSKSKYHDIRKKLQTVGAGKLLKRMRRRDGNIQKNINHHVSKKIVNIANENNLGIRLEKLSGIRRARGVAKSFRYPLNSWSFFQLQQMIEYKAKLLGIEVSYVEPAYTSKNCSKCGSLGNRSRKQFKCPSCGHVDHADSNAAFNIALRGRLYGDRDSYKGRTDTPQAALVSKSPKKSTVKAKSLSEKRLRKPLTSPHATK